MMSPIIYDVDILSRSHPGRGATTGRHCSAKTRPRSAPIAAAFRAHEMQPLGEILNQKNACHRDLCAAGCSEFLLSQRRRCQFFDAVAEIRALLRVMGPGEQALRVEQVLGHPSPRPCRIALANGRIDSLVQA